MPKRSRYYYSRMANFGEYAQKGPPVPMAAQPQKRARANTLGERFQSIEATDKENASPVETWPEPERSPEIPTKPPGSTLEHPPAPATQPLPAPLEPRNPEPVAPASARAENPRAERRPYKPPPSPAKCREALEDIWAILFPRRVRGHTQLEFEGDRVLHRRLIMMKEFLCRYLDTSAPVGWMEASVKAAEGSKRSRPTAEKLRAWTRDFIDDRDDLPYHDYGQWSESLLVKGDLAAEIREHLLSLGKYICAMDVVRFLNTQEIKDKYSLEKTISLATAKRWLRTMGYRWTVAPNGQYIDGHERGEVVDYRQGKFLPHMLKVNERMRWYTIDVESAAGEVDVEAMDAAQRRVIVWYHDESVFYANDRRKLYWVHEDEKAGLKVKGEGASLMVSDFISADFGWLCSLDGAESARVLMKPGKNRDGYFTNDDILKQLNHAIDIVQRCWPQFDHEFVLDNARTHLKRAEDALSARKMSKNPTKIGQDPSKIFGVDVNVLGPEGKPLYEPDGKLRKQRVQMSHGTLSDGSPQPLYYPSDHPTNPGGFKGMAEILQERGYQNTQKLRCECKDFKCHAPATPGERRYCCCRRILYEEPDFVNVESKVEALCRSRGIGVTFLPKFHCELNPIERCWAYAKRIYRMNPTSSSEADLERNVIDALNAVPLTSIRRFVISCFRYMDGYSKGLTGAQAAYAMKKYHGHRQFPSTILADLDKVA